MKKQKKEFKPLSESTTSKKVSFFSAVLIVIGGSIGAGIFFKSEAVLNNSQQSLILAIFSWIIAALSVMAMALALSEIASARNDNLSMIGWCKVFNKRATYKACKNFMFYVYLPLTYFFMPLYVLLSLQDGFGALLNKNDASPLVIGTSVDWIFWTLISLSLSAYFIFISGMSAKAGSIQNNIITYIKFLPLALVSIIGFILAGSGMSSINIEVTNPTNPGFDYIQLGNSIDGLSGGLGLFLAMGAIYFAYDGFYVGAGIQSDMKEPKKTPLALLVGLGIVTLIYLIIAISMSINGGSFSKMLDSMMSLFGNDIGRILFGIINIMIAIGVLGILNGFAMWGPRFIEDLIKEGELPLSFKFKDKLNSKKPMIGIYYLLISSFPVIIIFTLIGSMAYIGSPSYDGKYGSGMSGLYNFADLMGTWTAVFTFGFITMSIFGGFKNRKTNNIEVKKVKYFKPVAVISIISISIALGTIIILPIIDLFLLQYVSKEAIIINAISENKELIDAGKITEVEVIANAEKFFNDISISRIMKVIVLFIFIGLSYGPTFVEDFLNKKKYGSLEKYEEWRNNNFKIT